MCDFCAERSVVHQQYIQIFDIFDNELFVPIREMELCFLVRSVPDFRHFLITSKSPSHSVVDTYIKEH